jgi:hypothetical protein
MNNPNNSISQYNISRSKQFNEYNHPTFIKDSIKNDDKKSKNYEKKNNHYFNENNSSSQNYCYKNDNDSKFNLDLNKNRLDINNLNNIKSALEGKTIEMKNNNLNIGNNCNNSGSVSNLDYNSN